MTEREYQKHVRDVAARLESRAWAAEEPLVAIWISHKERWQVTKSGGYFWQQAGDEQILRRVAGVYGPGIFASDIADDMLATVPTLPQRGCAP